MTPPQIESGCRSHPAKWNATKIEAVEELEERRDDDLSGAVANEHDDAASTSLYSMSHSSNQ